MKKFTIARGFEIIAGILAVLTMAAVTCYMIQEVSAGRLPWWPYPVLALFYALIFLAYSFIPKGEGAKILN